MTQKEKIALVTFELSEICTRLRESGDENFNEFEIRAQPYNDCGFKGIDFYIDASKRLWRPNKKIARLSREEIDASCKKHYWEEREKEFELTEENKSAILKIADRTTELLSNMYDEAFKLQKIFKERAKNGNALFQEFEIEGMLKYHNHGPFGSTDKRRAYFLCEAANLAPAIHCIRVNEDSADSEDERNEQIFISSNPTLNWNIGVFKWASDHTINYFMHSLFHDGDIYTLCDLARMKSEDWQGQIRVRFDFC